jgi:hypothetical protein
MSFYDLSKVLTDYYTEKVARRLSSEVLPKLLDARQGIGELELGKSHGKRIPTLDNFFAVCDERGSPQYIANLITDMSQQKEIGRQLLQAKEAAVSADRTKSMFIPPCRMNCAHRSMRSNTQNKAVSRFPCARPTARD